MEELLVTGLETFHAGHDFHAAHLITASLCMFASDAAGRSPPATVINITTAWGAGAEPCPGSALTVEIDEDFKRTTPGITPWR